MVGQSRKARQVIRLSPIVAASLGRLVNCDPHHQEEEEDQDEEEEEEEENEEEEGRTSCACETTQGKSWRGQKF